MRLLIVIPALVVLVYSLVKIRQAVKQAKEEGPC